MKLLITAVVFFVSLALKQLTNNSILFLPSDEIVDNSTSHSSIIPGFVDISRVYNSRNVSLAGYTTIRAIRDVLDRSGFNLTAERDVRLNRVEFKMASVCHDQHALALDILKSVES